MEDNKDISNNQSDNEIDKDEDVYNDSNPAQSKNSSEDKKETQKIDFDTLSLNEKSIMDYCLNEIQGRNFADLFISEPFYMKNVFINKINKL